MTVDLSPRELIVIMTALKELETNIETSLPHIGYVSDNTRERDILLDSMTLLDDVLEMQTDFCLRISSL